MNIVHSFGISLVAIPEKEFTSYPKDRSLSLLALDARSLRRRAVKGVGVEIQRGLFVQVARRLDSIASEISVKENYCMRGIEAEAWLQLTEILEHTRLGELLRKPPEPVSSTAVKSIVPTVEQPDSSPAPTRGIFGKLRSLFGSAQEKSVASVTPIAQTSPPPAPKPVEVKMPSLGEQVIFPGDEVTRWHHLLRELDPDHVRANGELWSALGSNRCTSLMCEIRDFFARAHTNRAAVMQVFSDFVTT
jgi:hypothetical protein